MTPDEARLLIDVRADASAEEARRAYRAMLRTWHPDRHPRTSPLHEVATARTRTVIEAFRVVLDQEPAKGDAFAPPPAPAADVNPSASGWDPLIFTSPSPEKAVGLALEPSRGRGYRTAAVVGLVSVTIGIVGLTLQAETGSANTVQPTSLIPVGPPGAPRSQASPTPEVQVGTANRSPEDSIAADDRGPVRR